MRREERTISRRVEREERERARLLSSEEEGKKTYLLIPRLPLLAAYELVSIPVLLLMFCEMNEELDQVWRATRRRGRNEGLTNAAVAN